MMSHTKQKNELERLNRVIRRAEVKIGRIKDKCVHVIENSGLGTARCNGCDTSFGFWCDNSPDNICHDISEIFPQNDKATIELIGGGHFRLERLEDNNKCQCIFCGDYTDERK